MNRIDREKPKNKKAKSYNLITFSETYYFENMQLKIHSFTQQRTFSWLVEAQIKQYLEAIQGVSQADVFFEYYNKTLKVDIRALSHIKREIQKKPFQNKLKWILMLILDKCALETLKLKHPPLQYLFHIELPTPSTTKKKTEQLTLF